MTQPQVQPLELSTRIRYEIRHEISNGEHYETTGEGVIISSCYDSKIAPWYRYDVSESGVSTPLDHYPFEIYTDMQEIDDPDIVQFLGEDEKWHYYLPGDRYKKREE
jgi:hypothetical protein